MSINPAMNAEWGPDGTWACRDCWYHRQPCDCECSTCTKYQEMQFDREGE